MVRVSCANCRFRAEEPKTFYGGRRVLYPCRLNPPQMLPTGENKDGRVIAVPFWPLMEPSMWCSHWVDRETLETLDTVEGIR